MTLCIDDIQLNITQGYADCKDYVNVMLSVVMLNVVMLNIIMLNFVMLNVIMLNFLMLRDVMLIVVMLSVVAPQPQMLGIDVDE